MRALKRSKRRLIAAVRVERIVRVTVIVGVRLECLVLVEPGVGFPVTRRLNVALDRRRVEPVRDPVGELRLVVRQQRIAVADDQVVRRGRPLRVPVEEVLVTDNELRSRNGF